MSSPVLNDGELELLLKDPYLKTQILPTFFDIRKGVEGSLEKTLNKICEAADEAVRNGSQLLILSDRSDELVRTILCALCFKFAFLMGDHFTTLSLSLMVITCFFKYFVTIYSFSMPSCIPSSLAHKFSGSSLINNLITFFL